MFEESSLACRWRPAACAGVAAHAPFARAHANALDAAAVAAADDRLRAGIRRVAADIARHRRAVDRAGARSYALAGDRARARFGAVDGRRARARTRALHPAGNLRRADDRSCARTCRDARHRAGAGRTARADASIGAHRRAQRRGVWSGFGATVGARVGEGSVGARAAVAGVCARRGVGALRAAVIERRGGGIVGPPAAERDERERDEDQDENVRFLHEPMHHPTRRRPDGDPSWPSARRRRRRGDRHRRSRGTRCTCPGDRGSRSR
jgi:hypothetical protein